MPAAKKPAKQKKMFVANTSGFIHLSDGNDHGFRKDVTIVSEDDEMYKRGKLFFSPVEDKMRGVEQATAAPGEERNA